MNDEKNLIFTYLNLPKETPGYINLCIKTWQKYIPEGYNVVILNPENLKDYISAEILNKNIYDRISSDSSFFAYEYIAAAVLYCNGGIFLNPGIIMTDKFSPPDILLSKFEIILYGSSKTDPCAGFMMARKNASILEELLRRLAFFTYLPETQNYKPFMLLKDILKEDCSQSAIVLDCEESGYLMEKAMYGVSDQYLYSKYYFSNICNTKDFFKTEKGLTALQIENTPDIYKNMTEEEFLYQDILLSKIFKTLL